MSHKHCRSNVQITRHVTSIDISTCMVYRYIYMESTESTEHILKHSKLQLKALVTCIVLDSHRSVRAGVHRQRSQVEAAGGIDQ